MRARKSTAFLVLLAVAWMAPLDAQVRSTRRGTVAKGEDGRAAAAGPRGVAVKGEEGYAAAGRHGAVAKGDEGYAAVGRHGAVAQGEEGYGRVGPRGAVVAGEEGVAVGRRGGVVVGHRYESYEAWKVVAGVGAAIAVGTMLAKPPKAAAPVASPWHPAARPSTTTTAPTTRASSRTARRSIRSSTRQPASSSPHCPLAAARLTSAASPTANAGRRTTRSLGGLSGGRAAVEGRTSEVPSRLVPPLLLFVMAVIQIALARTADLTPWKGGGFGMFATLDHAAYRAVDIVVDAPDRSEALEVPSRWKPLWRGRRRIRRTGCCERWPKAWRHGSVGVSVRSRA